MDPSSKLPLMITLLIIWTAMVTARPLDYKPSLVARLKLDESLSTAPTCWDSLYELQACTGEVIQFFYEGQANLGKECCQAIYVIGHNCWPAMLGSLGFTAEETALLQGYCDAEEESAPSPSNDR